MQYGAIRGPVTANDRYPNRESVPRRRVGSSPPTDALLPAGGFDRAGSLGDALEQVLLKTAEFEVAPGRYHVGDVDGLVDAIVGQAALVSHAKEGTNLGTLPDVKTLAAIPTTPPVGRMVPMPVLLWSPMIEPTKCCPVSTPTPLMNTRMVP